MPPTRRRQRTNNRRSNSASSAPVLGDVPRSVPATRGRRPRVLVPATTSSIGSASVERGPGQENGTARITGRRSRLRNPVDVSSGGRINRRNNRREEVSRGWRTSRESLDILREYLLQCERNLIECHQQRGKLSDLVEHLVKDDDKPLPEEELHYQQFNDALHHELQELLNESRHITEQQLPNSELPELMASVRFVAEHRGEETDQTLNELMRRHPETATPMPIEMDQGGVRAGISPTFGDDIVDIVVHGQDLDAVNQVNGILAVVFGMGEEERSTVVGESDNGSTAT